MILNLKRFSFYLCCFTFVTNIQSQIFLEEENNFYTPPIESGKEEILTITNVLDDVGVDDSLILQNLINVVSNYVHPTDYSKKGGIIKIPAGKYFFDNIIMKSNVHIKVSKDATLIMGPVPDTTKNIKMFLLGKDKDTEYTKNVSITCDSNNKDDFFTVNFKTADYDSQRFLGCSMVENFLISNAKIIDDYTRLPTIGFTNAKTDNKFYRPINGVVKNIISINSGYGYGQIQMHAGKKILFKNLYGEGGVVLRLEPHYRENEPGQVLIDSIIGRDISGKLGNATVMLSPHKLDHGYVNMKNIKANTSGFALRIEGGFSSKVKDPNTGELIKYYDNNGKEQRWKRGREYDSNGIEITGSFDSKSIFDNIEGIYGTNAQLKQKHFNLIPCSIFNNSLISVDQNGYRISRNQNGETSYIGPAITSVLLHANYPFDNPITNIKAIKYKEQINDGMIFTVNDSKYDCPELILSNNLFTKKNFNISIKKNLQEDRLYIETPTKSIIKLIDLSGRLITSTSNLNNKISFFKLSNLNKGFYLVKVINNNNIYSKKIYLE